MEGEPVTKIKKSKKQVEASIGDEAPRKKEKKQKKNKAAAAEEAPEPANEPEILEPEKKKAKKSKPAADDSVAQPAAEPAQETAKPSKKAKKARGTEATPATAKTTEPATEAAQKPSKKARKGAAANVTAPNAEPASGPANATPKKGKKAKKAKEVATDAGAAVQTPAEAEKPPKKSKKAKKAASGGEEGGTEAVGEPGDVAAQRENGKKKGSKRKDAAEGASEPLAPAEEPIKAKKSKKRKRTTEDDGNTAIDAKEAEADVPPAVAASSKELTEAAAEGEAAGKMEVALAGDLGEETVVAPAATRQGTAAQAFQRVKAEEWLNSKAAKDNSYRGTFGNSGWGAKAEEVLGQVRGKDFRHEKTKKKRGSYKGGLIDNTVNSFKFESDDE